MGAPALLADLRMGARRRAAFGHDADPLARRAVAELPLDDIGAGEAALLRAGAWRCDQFRPASTGVVVSSMSWP